MPQIGPVHEFFLVGGITTLTAGFVTGMLLTRNLWGTPIGKPLLFLTGAMGSFAAMLGIHVINRLNALSLLPVELAFRSIGLILLALFVIAITRRLSADQTGLRRGETS